MLVDLDDEKVARGMSIIEKTLADGVAARDLHRGRGRRDSRQRITGTSRFEDLAAVDLVVEAVFEDIDDQEARVPPARRGLPPRRDPRDQHVVVRRHRARGGDDAAGARGRAALLLPSGEEPARRGRRRTGDRPGRVSARLALQEVLGKTPIASSDSYGFIVNRFFLPWLNEAVRMLDEGVADTATIEEAAKQAFGIGMGPFELMNVTGVPIALHTATTLGRAFGPMYEAPALLARAGGVGQALGDRRHARRREVHVGGGSAGGGRVLRRGRARRRGGGHDRGHRHRRARRAALAARPVRDDEPLGIERAGDLVAAFAARWNLPMPGTLARQARRGPAVPLHARDRTSPTASRR